MPSRLISLASLASSPSPARRRRSLGQGLNPVSLAFSLVCAACTTLLSASCSTPDPTNLDVKTPTGNERDTEIKHDPCDFTSGSARRIDVNGDGKPDITHVSEGGREVCRVVDLNLDGLIDAFIYYDAQGFERRRESDFDRDNRPDEITYLQGGVVIRKERETNFDNKLDTWDYYDAGRLARRERDSDGDGVIDQWWHFNNLTDSRCAVVASDRNSDGKPDPESIIDLCGESYSGPAPSYPAPQPGLPNAPPGAMAPMGPPAPMIIPGQQR